MVLVEHAAKFFFAFFQNESSLKNQASFSVSFISRFGFQHFCFRSPRKIKKTRCFCNKLASKSVRDQYRKWNHMPLLRLYVQFTRCHCESKTALKSYKPPLRSHIVPDRNCVKPSLQPWATWKRFLNGVRWKRNPWRCHVWTQNPELFRSALVSNLSLISKQLP